MWNDVEAVAVVLAIWELIPFFSNISFSFVPRNCNRDADRLAKFAKIKKSDETWINQCPRSICNWASYGLFSEAQVA